MEIRVHVIEIRGGGVEKGVGGDEKQLIKFAWPYRGKTAKNRYAEI